MRGVDSRFELDGTYIYIPCQRIQKSRPGRERMFLYDGAITQACGTSSGQEKLFEVRYRGSPNLPPRIPMKNRTA